MNENLQKDLSTLENLIKVQKDCLIDDHCKQSEYMRGLLNGLIISHSVFTKEIPKYHNTIEKKKITHIRHKSLLKRK